MKQNYEIKVNVKELFNITNETTLDSLQDMYYTVQTNVQMNQVYLDQLHELIVEYKNNLIYQQTKEAIDNFKSDEIANVWKAELSNKFKAEYDAMMNIINSNETSNSKSEKDTQNEISEEMKNYFNTRIKAEYDSLMQEVKSSNITSTFSNFEDYCKYWFPDYNVVKSTTNDKLQQLIHDYTFNNETGEINLNSTNLPHKNEYWIPTSTKTPKFSSDLPIVEKDFYEYTTKKEKETGKTATAPIFDGNTDYIKLPKAILINEEGTDKTVINKTETDTHYITWYTDGVEFKEKPNRYNNQEILDKINGMVTETVNRETSETDTYDRGINKTYFDAVNDAINTANLVKESINETDITSDILNGSFKSEKHKIEDLVIKFNINVKHYANGYNYFKELKNIIDEYDIFSFNDFLNKCETDIEFFNKFIIDIIGKEYKIKQISDISYKLSKLKGIKLLKDAYKPIINDYKYLGQYEYLTKQYDKIVELIDISVNEIINSKCTDMDSITSLNIIGNVKEHVHRYDLSVAEYIKEVTDFNKCELEKTDISQTLGGPESRINPYTKKTGDIGNFKNTTVKQKGNDKHTLQEWFDHINSKIVTNKTVKIKDVNSFDDAYTNYTGNLSREEFIKKCAYDKFFANIHIPTKTDNKLNIAYKEFLQLGITPLYPNIRSFRDFETRCLVDEQFRKNYTSNF